MVDVLIVTALPLEYEAAKEVAVASSSTPWLEQDTGTATPYLLGNYPLANGRTVSVALARPTRMGGPATLPTVASLVERLKPHCLAMCGVCAGNPADTALGDVIISEMVYYYDEGKRTAGGFEGDHRQYPMTDLLVRAAQQLDPQDLPSYGTPSREQARIWLLERLHAGDQPQKHPARSRYFSSSEWAAEVRALLAEELISRERLKLSLTDRGRSLIEEFLVLDVGTPERLPFEVKAGPITSGNVVVKDGLTWNRLKRWGVRSVLGLEMEAAAIGSAALRLNVPSWVVAKGVMDHADPRKDDRHKPFAARASAEVLFKFLSDVFDKVPLSPSMAQGRDEPLPVVDEPAIEFRLGKDGVLEYADDELAVHCAESIRALKSNPNISLRIVSSEVAEATREVARIDALPERSVRDREIKQILLERLDYLEGKHRLLQKGLGLILGEEDVRSAWYDSGSAIRTAIAVAHLAKGTFETFINKDNSLPLVIFPGWKRSLTASFELTGEDSADFMKANYISFPLSLAMFDGLKVGHLPTMSRIRHAVPAAVLSICTHWVFYQPTMTLDELRASRLLDILSWELRLD